MPSSSWNNIIKACATRKGNNGDSQRETIWIFNRMRRSRIRPDVLTYPFLFKSCALLLALKQGQQIQVDTLKRGLDSDVYVQNTIIHFYGSCKKIVDARQVFDEMQHRSVVSWNSIISAFVQVSWFYESLECFMKMVQNGFEPDGTTMVVMLSVCAELGNLTMGKCVHSRIIEKGLELNCQLGTSLVNMYAKCGALNLARQLFDEIPNRNVWTWSAMILGLAQHGLARDAIALFKKMKETSIQPNYVTFLGVICACSHAGFVEDAYQFFYQMKQSYGIEPQLTHYGAMVDVLGRSGRVKEAYYFIINMHIKADATVWRSLFSACNIHDTNDIDGIREKVRKRLIELEPRWGGNLVMVANKYAEVCQWNKAAQVRKSMRVKGLKNRVGKSCIEVHGSTFRFLSGCCSKASCKNLYLLLDGLSLNMEINNA